MIISTTTPLYRHQKDAVAKIARLKVGALFMDMGTGKTRTAIEIAKHKGDKIDRVIWIAPTSLKATVAHEIEKHVREPSVYVFDDKTTPKRIPDAFWYVVGVEAVGSSDRVVLSLASLITSKTMLILDESSYIKNHYAKRTRRLTKLAVKARYRYILTGTPISQGLEDIYSQMTFLSPKILGYNSFYAFARRHLEYSDKYPGMIVSTHNTGYLAAKIAPYIYQVTKDECLDLPEKIFERRSLRLTRKQRDAYAQAKDELLFSLDIADDDYIQWQYAIFQLFTVLQQIISGFWHRTDPETGAKTLLEFPHDRLAVLHQTLADIPPDAKVIIWVRYLYSLREIAASLDDACLLYGDLDETEREAELKRFRCGSSRYLIATQGTGGHGLNLTEATYAVYYQNGFKYADRIQSEDRMHRIGQTVKPTYVDLVADGTIDNRIMKAIRDKGDTLASFRKEVHSVRDSKRRLHDLYSSL